MSLDYKDLVRQVRISKRNALAVEILKTQGPVPLAENSLERDRSLW